MLHIYHHITSIFWFFFWQIYIIWHESPHFTSALMPGGESFFCCRKFNCCGNYTREHKYFEPEVFECLRQKMYPDFLSKIVEKACFIGQFRTLERLKKYSTRWTGFAFSVEVSVERFPSVLEPNGFCYGGILSVRSCSIQFLEGVGI